MDDSVKRWGEALAEHQPPTLRAELSIVTPMFIGDGIQQADSVRPPSIKGALRFWWRALNWAPALDAAKGDTDRALAQLHQDEAQLFGAAAKQDAATQQPSGGQGLFRLAVEQPAKLNKDSGWPKGGNSQGGYLGYGLWETRSSSAREFLTEGQSFTLTLAFKAAATAEHRRQMRQAVTLWGLLGGLGSRARRGFGSVALTALDGEPMAVTSAADYTARIQAALGDAPWPEAPQQVPFTAWSRQARCLAFATATSARQAIGHIEGPYKEVRTELRGKQKAVYGLPLAGHDDKNRRAGPLIMHVHPLGDGFLPIVTYLPARFHPAYPEATLADAQSAKPLEQFLQHSKESLL